MNKIKKILATISLVVLGLSSYAQGPYHEDVGNGKWVIIERIRSIKALRFADGTTQTTAYTAGAMNNTIEFVSTSDTIEFSELPKDYQFDVAFLVTFDTLTSNDVTVTLEDKQYLDSSYTSLNTSTFPYTLNSNRSGEDNGYIFLINQVLKYQRAVIDWGTSTNGALTISRRY